MYARVLVQAAVFAAASPSLTLPERVRRVVLEVGSNDDPVVAVGEDALTIAFEPLMDVVARTRPHANLRMVPAAVTADGEAGLRAFHFYNDRGWSSSLGTPAQPGQFWNNAPARGDGTVALVPALGLGDVLDSLGSVDVALLKTDMQGADFGAVASAGTRVRRIAWLLTELWVDNVRTYAGFDNDLCRDWLPHMAAQGFSLVGLDCGGALADLPSCGGAPADAWTADGAACCAANRAEHPNATAGLRECDALWARDGATGDPPPVPPGVWENVWGPSMVIT